MDNFTIGFGIGSGVAQRPQQPSVRLPAVAGQFYPAQPGELVAMVDNCLAEAPISTETVGTVRAMICPHAGYKFSGKAAAANFKLLKPNQFARVIVIGPSHYHRFRGASVPNYSAFRTPLGDVPVDRAACAALRRCSAVNDDLAAHGREHSIEVELPFLQRTLGQFQLVPIVTGEMQRAGQAALAEALAPLWDERTLLVASSDFCHYGPNFRFQPFGTGEHDRIANLDASALDQIQALNPTGFAANVALTHNTICGHVAIGQLLALASRAGGLRATQTSYYMSGDLFSDYQNSVSYASVVFSDGGHAAVESNRNLSEEEQKVLLREARASVEQAVIHRDHTPKVASRSAGSLPDKFLRAGAAFVTLTRKADGQLRGCRGSIVPLEPLIYSIRRSAIEAAVQDPRFAPVAPDELPGLDLEINVLHPPQLVRGIEDFVLGKHGLILSVEDRRGLFLPEVMTRQNWSPEETLAHLCNKAGVHPQAWRNGYTLYTFETQAFGENHHG